MDDPEAKEDIPEAIMKPWAEVCSRLGKTDCYCGIYETVMSNATWKDITRPLEDRWNLDNIKMYYDIKANLSFSGCDIIDIYITKLYIHVHQIFSFDNKS